MINVARHSVASTSSRFGVSLRRDSFVGLGFFLALILLAYVCLKWLPSPAPAAADAAPGAFSAARALIHIRAIAQVPHPTGSPEQEQVRDYLLRQLNSLGLETQIQSTSTVKN